MISGNRVEQAAGAMGRIFLCAALGLASGCASTQNLNKGTCEDENQTSGFWGFYQSSEKKFNEKCPIMNLMQQGVQQSGDPVLQIMSQYYLESQDPQLKAASDKAREEVLKVYHQGWNDAAEERKKQTLLTCQLSKNITRNGKAVITFKNCMPVNPQP